MEQAIVFGKYDNLMGVVNIPSDLESNESSVAMILLTAGMLHNVGPYRMYVDIANELANKGIPSLRFDLSGIGESLGVGNVGKSIDRAAQETIEAMDFLGSTHGIENFILFGLCSGADDSVQTALKDDRVKGVIAIDGLGYQTSKSKLVQTALYMRKMLNLNKWISKVSQLISQKTVPSSLAMGSDLREFPDDAEQAGCELQLLSDRNTKLHFIYTGGTDYYHYAEQFYDMLPTVNWKNNESTVYFPHMDHAAILCEDRKQLVDHITDKTVEMISS